MAGLGLSPVMTPVLSKTYSGARTSYTAGSIYTGVGKDVLDSVWSVERAASGVDAIKISDGDVNVSVGWGTSPTAAKVARETVLATQTGTFRIEGRWIGWISASDGNVTIEQSKYK